jgi:hypothetical protein
MLRPRAQYRDRGQGSFRRTCRRKLGVSRGGARGTKFLAGGLGMTPSPYQCTQNDTFRMPGSSPANSYQDVRTPRSALGHA